MPHRPSSTDGHLLVSLLILRLSTTIGLPQEDARRYASPYRVRLSARTVRQLMALKAKLARPSRSWNPIPFLIEFTVVFFLIGWVVWAAAHAWHGSLISTALITLGITTVATVPDYVRKQRKHAQEPSVIKQPQKHDPEAALREIKAEEMRRILEYDRASRQRAEAHESEIEQERDRRAKEIETLEHEFARYKSIVGESNEETDE
jgi:hypothetical protein